MWLIHNAVYNWEITVVLVDGVSVNVSSSTCVRCVQCVMEKGISQDIDGDGLIDNTGADQTYDAWKMYGARCVAGLVFVI